MKLCDKNRDSIERIYTRLNSLGNIKVGNCCTNLLKELCLLKRWRVWTVWSMPLRVYFLSLLSFVLILGWPGEYSHPP